MTQTIETAVILAAGKGTRLRPYTHDIPKGFMKVGASTLIERSIRILKDNGIKNIIIGTGHLSHHYEKLAKDCGLQTFKNEDFDTTGSFHTLYCGRNVIHDDFLLLESDLLYHSDAILRLVESEHPDVILCSSFTNSNDEVYVSINEDSLAGLSKKMEDLSSVDAELVGIWRISRDLYKHLLNHHENASDATTKDYEVAIANSKRHVHVVKIDNLVWCEIDNEAHLKRANEEIVPKLD